MVRVRLWLDGYIVVRLWLGYGYIMVMFWLCEGGGYL